MHRQFKIFMLSLCLSLFGTAVAEEAPKAPPAPLKIENPKFALQQKGEAFFGKADAKVTVVEYASYSCPHCADFHMTVFPALEKKYIDTGKIKFIFRDFPLNAPALKAAMVVHCMPAEDKQKTRGLLFRTQNKWAFDKDFLLHLQQLAILQGMDKATYNQCIANKTVEDEVLKSRLEGNKQLGVSGTPTVFVNGERLEARANMEEAISAMIDKALAAPAKK